MDKQQTKDESEDSDVIAPEAPAATVTAEPESTAATETPQASDAVSSENAAPHQEAVSHNEHAKPEANNHTKHEAGKHEAKNIIIIKRVKKSFMAIMAAPGKLLMLTL